MYKTKRIESQLYDESYDNKEHKSNKLISPLLDLGLYLTNLRRLEERKQNPELNPCCSQMYVSCYQTFP